MNDYNRELCEEKHSNIEKEFDAVWKRFDTTDKRINGFDRKLWAVIILLLMNLTAISAIGLVLAK